MDKALTIQAVMTPEQQDTIGQTVKKERKRLFDFIRRRVNNEADAEDILQDVFLQLSLNYDMLDSIEKMASWLFRVAGNKIIDSYRKRKPVSLIDTNNTDGDSDGDDEFSLNLNELLRETGDEPDDIYTRDMVWTELELALAELPANQREVFVMHELEDKSFNEISEITGVPVNTLLSRKRYAVLYLRKRMKEMYDEIINYR